MSTGDACFALLCLALWGVAVLACPPPISRLVLVGALVGGLECAARAELGSPELKVLLGILSGGLLS